MPPFHITGDPNADWIIFAVGSFFALYWLRALRLAREGARLFIRNLLKAIIIFCFSMVALKAMQSHINLNPSQQSVIAGVVALIGFARFRDQKRSRYISKATRRAVIARDLKGEKFDPQKHHHVDHVWPFARGGSHTVDNLRVIDKAKNLKKGAKRPKMKEMW